MSKSYRRPYSAICGLGSAHYDKTVAARAVRRAQDQVLRDAVASGKDWDAVLIPHRYECTHNEVYGWNRDGKQRLQRADCNTFNQYAYHRLDYSWAPDNEFEWLAEAEKDHADWMARCSRK